MSAYRSRTGTRFHTVVVWILAPLSFVTLSGCSQPVIEIPSPSADTADQPPGTVVGVPVPLPPTVVLDGPGWEILIDGFTLLNIIRHPILPGGVYPGGDRQAFDGQVQVHLIGTGTLAGWQRHIVLPFSGMIDSDIRPYGAQIQSFSVELFGLESQINIDVDFDLLRIQAGAVWGFPSPGHTTLTRLGSGNWNVDSFFDITYQIDYVGAPGGVLAGQNGSQVRQAHVQIGQPVASDVWQEQGDAPPLPPGQETSGGGPLNSISGALSLVSDVDLYCIYINDPLQFQATTVGGASFNTQLFLFDLGGMGVSHNDDNPGGGLQSTITGQWVPVAGPYLLAVSAVNRDPVNPLFLPIWNNSPLAVERPPDGPGAPGPLVDWQFSTAVIAPYTIMLSGCSFCSTILPPVPPGNDYWVIDEPPGFHFGGPEYPPIPADFFAPGSQPFSGIVYFGGQPLDENIGDADTIVRRLEPLDLPAIGSTDTVPIEIIALNLLSVDPIVVDGVEWKVELGVPPPQPNGNMTVQRATPNGGSFESTILVRPMFIFTRVDGVGGPRIFDPGVVIQLAPPAPANWSSVPPPQPYPGAGPGFFPTDLVELSSVGGMHTTLEPGVETGPPTMCPPLDLNLDNEHDGLDLNPLVEAILTGPSHPAFCAVDANANHVSDVEDIALAVMVLLNWPSTPIAAGDWVNVDADCDFKHHQVTGECRAPPRANKTRHILVQAADKDGTPSNCPVKFRLYNCDGAGVDKAQDVEAGDNECATVPEHRTLKVWCKRDADNVPCRISVKDVGSCPPSK